MNELTPYIEIPAYEVEVVTNNDPRTIVTLIIDTSKSTAGPPNREVNGGMQRFTTELHANVVARTRIEVGVVEFGGGVRVHRFVTADEFRAPTFAADGDTPMGAAIITGLQETKQRLQWHNQRGIPCTRPLGFLLTDGDPTDPWQEAADLVHRADANKDIAFFAIGVQNANMRTLAAIAPPNRPPRKLDGLKFTEFFVWLSVNLSRVSQAHVGQQLALTPASTWAVSL